MPASKNGIGIVIEAQKRYLCIMIRYETATLDNGLTVAVNRDRSSKLAAVNILYKVGARNEDAEHTGFAHLFEHLMFRGTSNVPDFDVPVQMACGENNAFTNNDYTDFYITLPRENIETALWLESDRMRNLDLSPEACATEKSVVIEEYKQRYLNQPYGDETMLLRSLAYKVHPYRWSTIGMSPDHIARATIEDVRRFYDRYYQPSQAILSMSADMEEGRMIDPCQAVVRLDTRPAAAAPEHTGRAAADGGAASYRRARRACDQYLDSVPHGRPPLARLLSGRPVVRSALGRRLVASGGAACQGAETLFERQRLYSRQPRRRTVHRQGSAYALDERGAQAEEALRGEIGELMQGELSDYEMDKVKNKFEANALMGRSTS